MGTLEHQPDEQQSLAQELKQPLESQEVLKFRKENFKDALSIYLKCYENILELLNNANEKLEDDLRKECEDLVLEDEDDLRKEREDLILEDKYGLIKELKILIWWEKNKSTYEKLKTMKIDDLNSDDFDECFNGVKDFLSELSGIFDRVLSGDIKDLEESLFIKFIGLMWDFNKSFMGFVVKNKEKEKNEYKSAEFVYSSDGINDSVGLNPFVLLEISEVAKKYKLYREDNLKLSIYVYSSLLNYINEGLKNLLYNRWDLEEIKWEIKSKRHFTEWDYKFIMGILRIESKDDFYKKFSKIKQIQEKIDELNNDVKGCFDDKWNLNYENFNKLGEMKDLSVLLDTTSVLEFFLKCWKNIRNVLGGIPVRVAKKYQ